MTSYFIKNGHVIDPSQKLDKICNIIVRDGRIAELTTRSTVPDGATVIDAKNYVVAPGLVDVHCHLREPGQSGKEDMATGTASAAAGGFTSIACMANTTPVNDSALITQWIQAQARARAHVHVYPIGAVTKGLQGEHLAEMAQMKAAGIVAVSDDGMCIMNAQVMRNALNYASQFELPVIIHAEDSCLCGNGVMHEGRVSARLGLPGKPAESEEVIVKRDLALARFTGARLHVAHVSSAETVAAIRAAKREGLHVTAEVTPHHLALTDEALSNYNVNAKINPPVRDDFHRTALIAGLRDGTIDMIATDHAPHSILDKDGGMMQAACGMVGFETALGLCLMLVHSGVLTLSQLITRMSTAPAEFLKLPAGSLKVGSVADITIFNPDETWMVDSRHFKSKSHNSPFDGWTLQGRVQHTLVAGKVVYSLS